MAKHLKFRKYDPQLLEAVKLLPNVLKWCAYSFQGVDGCEYTRSQYYSCELVP
jgi:hypothetical protein